MTRTATSLLGAAASLSWGAAAALMISLSRAPASADFLLPRRAAYWWFEGFIRAQQTPGLRAAYSWAALLLAGAGLAAWLAALAVELAAWEPAARTLRRFVICAGAVIGVAWAGRWALSLFLEIMSGAWFPPESLDWREPALAFLAAHHAAWGVFGASLAFCRAAGTAAAGASRELLGRFFGRLILLILPAAILAAVGGSRWDLGKTSLAEAGRSPEVRRIGAQFQIAVQEDGAAPAFRPRVLRSGGPGAAVYSPRGMAALVELAESRSLFARQARRELYQSCALSLDPEGLRNALVSGHDQGDPLARLLLLRNLARAPARPENLAALQAMADLEAWRIGPAASLLMADALDHFGDDRAAALLRSSAGRGAIPPGLLAGLEDAAPGPSKGVVRGSFRGRMPRKAALFIRDPGPDGYVLDPAGLVAAAVPDAKGRFEFRGLPDGDYFLVLSPAPEVRLSRVSGAPGDIRLGEGRRLVELKPIELK